MRAVGYDYRKGWKEPILFYGWRCKGCGKPVIDYAHSFPGQQYVVCPICSAKEEVS